MLRRFGEESRGGEKCVRLQVCKRFKLPGYAKTPPGQLCKKQLTNNFQILQNSLACTVGRCC